MSSLEEELEAELRDLVASAQAPLPSAHSSVVSAAEALASVIGDPVPSSTQMQQEKNDGAEKGEKGEKILPEVLQQLKTDYSTHINSFRFEYRRFKGHVTENLPRATTSMLAKSRPQCLVCGHQQHADAKHWTPQTVDVEPLFEGKGGGPYPPVRNTEVTAAHILKQTELADDLEVNFGTENVVPLCGNALDDTLCCHRYFDLGYLCLFPRWDGGLEVLTVPDLAFLRQTISKERWYRGKLPAAAAALAAHCAFALFADTNRSPRYIIEWLPKYDDLLRCPPLRTSSKSLSTMTTYDKVMCYAPHGFVPAVFSHDATAWSSSTLLPLIEEHADNLEGMVNGSETKGTSPQNVSTTTVGAGTNLPMHLDPNRVLLFTPLEKDKDDAAKKEEVEGIQGHRAGKQGFKEFVRPWDVASKERKQSEADALKRKLVLSVGGPMPEMSNTGPSGEEHDFMPPVPLRKVQLGLLTKYLKPIERREDVEAPFEMEHFPTVLLVRNCFTPEGPVSVASGTQLVDDLPCRIAPIRSEPVTLSTPPATVTTDQLQLGAATAAPGSGTSFRVDGTGRPLQPLALENLEEAYLARNPLAHFKSSVKIVMKTKRGDDIVRTEGIVNTGKLRSTMISYSKATAGASPTKEKQGTKKSPREGNTGSRPTNNIPRESTAVNDTFYIFRRGAETHLKVGVEDTMDEEEDYSQEWGVNNKTSSDGQAAGGATMLSATPVTYDHATTLGLLWRSWENTIQSGVNHEVSTPRAPDGRTDGQEQKRTSSPSLYRSDIYHTPRVQWLSELMDASHSEQGTTSKSKRKRCVVEVPSSGKKEKKEDGQEKADFSVDEYLNGKLDEAASARDPEDRTPLEDSEEVVGNVAETLDSMLSFEVRHIKLHTWVLPGFTGSYSRSDSTEPSAHPLNVNKHASAITKPNILPNLHITEIQRYERRSTDMSFFRASTRWESTWIFKDPDILLKHEDFERRKKGDVSAVMQNLLRFLHAVDRPVPKDVLPPLRKLSGVTSLLASDCKVGAARTFLGSLGRGSRVTPTEESDSETFRHQAEQSRQSKVSTGEREDATKRLRYHLSRLAPFAQNSLISMSTGGDDTAIVATFDSRDRKLLQATCTRHELESPAPLLAQLQSFSVLASIVDTIGHLRERFSFKVLSDRATPQKGKAKCSSFYVELSLRLPANREITSPEAGCESVNVMSQLEKLLTNSRASPVHLRSGRQQVLSQADEDKSNSEPIIQWQSDKGEGEDSSPQTQVMEAKPLWHDFIRPGSANFSFVTTNANREDKDNAGATPLECGTEDKPVFQAPRGFPIAPPVGYDHTGTSWTLEPMLWEAAPTAATSPPRSKSSSQQWREVRDEVFDLCELQEHSDAENAELDALLSSLSQRGMRLIRRRTLSTDSASAETVKFLVGGYQDSTTPLKDQPHFGHLGMDATTLRLLEGTELWDLVALLRDPVGPNENRMPIFPNSSSTPVPALEPPPPEPPKFTGLAAIVFGDDSLLEEAKPQVPVKHEPSWVVGKTSLFPLPPSHLSKAQRMSLFDLLSAMNQFFLGAHHCGQAISALAAPAHLVVASVAKGEVEVRPQTTVIDDDDDFGATEDEGEGKTEAKEEEQLGEEDPQDADQSVSSQERAETLLASEEGEGEPVSPEEARTTLLDPATTAESQQPESSSPALSAIRPLRFGDGDEYSEYGRRGGVQGRKRRAALAAATAGWAQEAAMMSSLVPMCCRAVGSPLRGQVLHGVTEVDRLACVQEDRRVFDYISQRLTPEIPGASKMAGEARETRVEEASLLLRKALSVGVSIRVPPGLVLGRNAAAPDLTGRGHSGGLEMVVGVTSAPSTATSPSSTTSAGVGQLPIWEADIDSQEVAQSNSPSLTSLSLWHRSSAGARSPQFWGLPLFQHWHYTRSPPRFTTLNKAIDEEGPTSEDLCLKSHPFLEGGTLCLFDSSSSSGAAADPTFLSPRHSLQVLKACVGTEDFQNDTHLSSASPSLPVSQYQDLTTTLLHATTREGLSKSTTAESGKPGSASSTATPVFWFPKKRSLMQQMRLGVGGLGGEAESPIQFVGFLHTTPTVGDGAKGAATTRKVLLPLSRLLQEVPLRFNRLGRKR